MADFKYVEDITTSVKVLNRLADIIDNQREGNDNYPVFDDSETPTPNKWEVFQREEDGEGNVTELILKSEMTVGELTKDLYVKFINHALVTRTYPTGKIPAHKEHSTLSVQVLDGYNEADDTFALEGHPVLYQWADESFKPTDRNEKKPVYMYVNFNNNRIAMVLVADPAVNFQDYLKSFLYVGAIKPFKYNMNDIEGNVALTAGAFVNELTSAEIASAGLYYYGEYTSPGNNSIQMLRTKSGIEFQKHYPSFITQAPPQGFAYNDPTLGDTGLVLEPQGFQASKWTGKYHLSPIYIVHPYEGYRGQFDGVIAVTKHNILHLDELIVDVEGKDWKQEVYRFFDINTPQSLMNFSANQRMGVAILKELRY